MFSLKLLINKPLPQLDSFLRIGDICCQISEIVQTIETLSYVHIVDKFWPAHSSAFIVDIIPKIV